LTGHLYAFNDITTRGFTGHEQVDAMGVIHMNGRIYDPKLGRFLQADPIVQAPKNSQSLNRYSYVLNNPLSYTDPTGYFSLKKVWRKVRQFVAIGVMIVGMIYAPYLAPLWGGLSGYISSGNIKGAVIGAFSAAVFQGIGNAFGRLAQSGKYAAGALRAGKTLAHGVVGGVMSELQGGKFGHGFAAAGFTQAFAGPIGEVDAGNVGFSVQRTLIAATIGGTASVLSGGKFANGAVTGGFSRMFNDELHKDDAVRKGISAGRQLRNRLESIRENPGLVAEPARSHAQFAGQAIYAGVYESKTGLFGIFGKTVYSVPGPYLNFEATAGSGFSVAFYALHTSHSGPGGTPSAAIVNYPRTTDLSSRVTNAVNLSEQIGNAPIYIDNGISTFSVIHTGAGYYSCSAYPSGGACN